MPDTTPNKRSLFNLLFWPLLFCLGIVSLIAALRWFFAMDLDTAAFSAANWRWMLAALLLQCLVLLIAAWAWQLNLKLHGLDQLRFPQALTMIGINTIGKYTPGKVWGLVARGAALFKLSNNKQVALLATVVEQSALLHCSVIIALGCYLLMEGQRLLLAALLALSLLSLFLAARSGLLIMRLSSFFTRKDAEPLIGQAFGKSYLVVFLLMSLIWLLSALALFACIAAFSDTVTIGFAELQLITIMSYLAGFLAFFTLAGLGVREGMMVAMLSLHMELPMALYISVIHRLVTLVPDLLIGCTALLSSWSMLEARTKS